MYRLLPPDKEMKSGDNTAKKEAKKSLLAAAKSSIISN
jgi:hypothetical protein